MSVTRHGNESVDLRGRCCYILRTSRGPYETEYCGAKTRKRMERDDDGIRRAKYEAVCVEHQSSEDDE